MKKSTVLLIAVLLVVFNAAAWKELRAEEVRDSEGYKLALCYEAFKYAQRHMSEEATDEQLEGYYKGQTEVTNKQQFTDYTIEEINDHKMHVAFAERDFDRFSIKEKQTAVGVCFVVYS